MAKTKGTTRTPAQDRARNFVAQAMAEGWSIRKFAKVAKVGQPVASKVLTAASKQTAAQLDSELGKQGNRALMVAQRSRDAQIEQAGRMDTLTEAALVAIEEKAAAGELSLKDLESLTRIKDKHWQHLKDMAGITVAEKIAIGQAKGDAQGAAIATTLIDSTAIEIGKQVWKDEADNIEEAEIVSD